MTTAVLVPNNQGINLSIGFNNHTESFKYVGGCKSPNNDQKKQVTILIERAKYWSRRISSSSIPRRILWQRLNAVFGYPGTTLFWPQVSQKNKGTK